MGIKGAEGMRGLREDFHWWLIDICYVHPELRIGGLTFR